MNDSPGESRARTGSQTPGRTSGDSDGSRSECSSKELGTKKPAATALPPSDPTRQAKRLPIRILKMLTAHSHLLHPDYLQPLTSAPVSIELDAKKSPLALLAQTCSQIGKPDPPPASKLGSIASGGLADKDGSGGGGQSSGSSSLKLRGEHHQSHDDKSSFKPYSKVGGECRKDGAGGNGGTDKAGFRVPGGGGSGGGSDAVSCSAFPPHAASPNSRTGSGSGSGSGSSPQHGQLQPHRQATQSPLTMQSQHPQALHANPKPAGGGGDSGNSDGANGGLKKAEAEPCKSALDGAQLANSSHARASANSSNASSDGSPHHDSGKGGDSNPSSQQPGGMGGPGHVAPVSPFKPGHSVFPLPPSSMGYHGSIVGAYAGYPSQFVPGLDHAKSALVGGGMGVAGKHPSSSPLSGGSPPSFMQGLCRDPYCLTYPNAAHLGGGNCTSCVHDPSALKSGFPLMYPTHPLHSLHHNALTSSVTQSLSHPLYTYGFMLPNEPAPHACNWVSAGGPCDKRFSSSEELLAHLRTHTALSGLDGGKLLSAYPSSISSSAAASCHLHLPPHGSPGSFSLRAPPSLGLARYHPYGKAHLPTAAGSLPMHSLQASAPYYSPYALYSQRLGSASALGYQ